MKSSEEEYRYMWKGDDRKGSIGSKEISKFKKIMKSRGEKAIQMAFKKTTNKNIPVSPSFTMGSELEVSPLRSLDDFLLESARFQIPNLKELEKWNNRVVQNLLYYQTNYFLMYIIVFILVGVMHPAKMFFGMIAMSVAFGLFYYITNAKQAATRFKQNHPVISVILILAGGYFIVHMLGSVIVFMFGILIPILLIFIHASMRLRNIKNKLVNKMETVGLKKTPMGVLLGVVGQDFELM